MFQLTRLKLTFWYMMILIFICACFSAVIYRLMSNEVDRFALAQQQRMEKRYYIPATGGPIVSMLAYDPELIREIKNRLFLSLVIIDLSIWLISSGLAYLLAGKTLRPIQLMVQEQHRFISDASHELKTPLTSLKTAFEVFSRDQHATIKDAKILIKESISEVDKLQALSENLLQLAQYQTPNGHQKTELVSLERIINDVVKTVKPMATQKKITIEKKLEDINIVGNSFALRDLMTILLDNAIKYSPVNSTVIVSLENKKDKTKLIKVQDFGVGIEKHDLPHIFDRFYRANSARSKTQAGGYGLGLAIAKKIVERHGGIIEVESLPHKGTTFLVKFN
jgi:two-component system sensor histidine kinase CiaH